MTFLNCSGGAIVREYLYYYDTMLSSVCRMNIETCMAEVVCEKEGNYDTILHIQGTLFFIGETLQEILTINSDNLKEGYINISNGSDYRVSRTFAERDMLIIVPIDTNRGIVLIDTKKGSYEELEAINSYEEIKNVENVFFPSIYGETVWFADYNSNRYFQYDYVNKEARTYELYRDIKLSSVFCEKEYIYATQTDKTSIILIKNERIIDDDLCKNGRPYQKPFSVFYKTEAGIVILPRYFDTFYLFYKGGYKTFCITNKPRDFKQPSKSLACELLDEQLFVYPYRKGGAFYSYNIDSCMVRKMVPEYDDEELICRVYGEYIEEQETAELNAFLDHILRQ